MLPNVYHPKERPWVQIENATTEELIAQISKCPSKALGTFLIQPALSSPSTSTQNPAQYDNQPYRVSVAALRIPEPEMFPPLEE